MIKHYKSRSAISINVVLRSGKSVHVPFTTQSDGSSVLVTDNPELQYALEHHYKFGQLFRVCHEVHAEEPLVGKPTAGERKEGAVHGEETVRIVKVSDLGAAKDFLADTFGMSRTSLRSEKSIMEAAKGHHIEFEGL